MKKMNGIAIGLSAVLLSAFAAAPAQAAPETLPSTQKVFAIDGADHLGTLWQLDATTAAATKVSTSLGLPSATGFTPTVIKSTAYNPVTKKSYIIAQDQVTLDSNSQNTNAFGLYNVNLTTGVAKFITLLSNESQATPLLDTCELFAIDNSGTAWINGNNDQLGKLFVHLNLTTGVVSNTNSIPNTMNFWDTAIAYDVKNSVMYGFGTVPMAQQKWFRIDMTTGASTEVKDLTTPIDVIQPSDPNRTVTGTILTRVAFDDNGIAWMTFANNRGAQTLATWNPSTGTVSPISNIYDASLSTYTNSGGEFNAPALLLSHVGADLVAPIVKKGITLKVGKKLALKTLATKLGLKPTAKSKITATVAKTSAKFCKVVKTNLVGTKKGACKVTVKTVTGKAKKSKTGTVTIN